MKQFLLKLSLFAMLAAGLAVPALAQVYSLPSPEVATTLLTTPNACSFSSATVRVAVSDPAYTGGILVGSLTAGPIYKTWYGRTYLWGYDFAGELQSPDGHTAAYEQTWQRSESGGRGFRCWFTPVSGTLQLNP